MTSQPNIAHIGPAGSNEPQLESLPSKSFKAGLLLAGAGESPKEKVARLKRELMALPEMQARQLRASFYGREFDDLLERMGDRQRSLPRIRGCFGEDD